MNQKATQKSNEDVPKDLDTPREMTELDRYIVNVLNRRAWPMWKPRYEAMNKVKVAIMFGKRKRVFMKCAMCGGDTFNGREVEVDHIVPRIDPIRGWEGLATWIQRTFVTADKLQILCMACHKIKSESENIVRREVKKSGKSESESPSVPRNRRRNPAKVKTRSRKKSCLVRRRVG